MNKKTYLTPATEIVKTETSQQLLAASLTIDINSLEEPLAPSIMDSRGFFQDADEH